MRTGSKGRGGGGTEEQDGGGAEAAETDELQQVGGDHARNEVAQAEDGVVRRGVGGSNCDANGHAPKLRRGHARAPCRVSRLVDKHPVWQGERDTLHSESGNCLHDVEPLVRPDLLNKSGTIGMRQQPWRVGCLHITDVAVVTLPA